MIVTIRATASGHPSHVTPEEGHVWYWETIEVQAEAPVWWPEGLDPVRVTLPAKRQAEDEIEILADGDPREPSMSDRLDAVNDGRYITGPAILDALLATRATLARVRPDAIQRLLPRLWPGILSVQYSRLRDQAAWLDGELEQCTRSLQREPGYIPATPRNRRQIQAAIERMSAREGRTVDHTQFYTGHDTLCVDGPYIRVLRRVRHFLAHAVAMRWVKVFWPLPERIIAEDREFTVPHPETEGEVELQA